MKTQYTQNTQQPPQTTHVTKHIKNDNTCGPNFDKKKFLLVKQKIWCFFFFFIYHVHRLESWRSRQYPHVSAKACVRNCPLQQLVDHYSGGVRGYVVGAQFLNIQHINER